MPIKSFGNAIPHPIGFITIMLMVGAGVGLMFIPPMWMVLKEDPTGLVPLVTALILSTIVNYRLVSAAGSDLLQNTGQNKQMKPRPITFQKYADGGAYMGIFILLWLVVLILALNFRNVA